MNFNVPNPKLLLITSSLLVLSACGSDNNSTANTTTAETETTTEAVVTESPEANSSPESEQSTQTAGQPDSSTQTNTTNQTDGSVQTNATEQTDDSAQKNTTDQADSATQTNTTNQTDASAQTNSTNQTDGSAQTTTTSQTDDSGSSGTEVTEDNDSKTDEPKEDVVNEDLLTGVFLDSAVSGLNYSTETQSGTTNDMGEFSFLADETITFSIGGITLPSTAAKMYLTPLSLYQTSDINQIEVVNLLRLLQTLDADGDASNGITITEEVQALAADLSLSFSEDDFTEQVATLVSTSGAVLQTLISAEDAKVHFQNTLDEINGSDMTSCTTSNDKVGHSGYFSTLAHNVSGKATIIDDCTIEITEFTYDGRGPAVYFYGALDHAYESSDAFAIGSLLTRDVEYDNESFQITLPQGKSLDDLSGLSVWCVDFAVNFGDMEFTP